MKRYSKARLKKYYAEQMLLEPVASQSEPHQIVRCCKCDSHKIEFHRTGDGEMYYKCPCGFESEPMGQAPVWMKE